MALHFGWSAAQWRKLSWWEQRLYVEELAFDGKLDPTASQPEEVGLDDFSASGITVRRI